MQTSSGLITEQFLIDTGADFLDRFVLTIDPGRRRIVLDEIGS